MSVTENRSEFEEVIGNDFASHYSRWLKNDIEFNEELQKALSYRSGAQAAIDEAKVFVADAGLAPSKYLTANFLASAAELCNSNRHSRQSEDMNDLPGKEFYLPRIFYLSLLQFIALRKFELSEHAAQDGIELIRLSTFELGALCREYQLAQANQRDALNHKRTKTRRSDRAQIANSERSANADKWRKPIKEEAGRRWAADPSSNASEMAGWLRSWLVKQGLGFSDQNAPKSDTIRKVIANLRPKRK